MTRIFCDACGDEVAHLSNLYEIKMGNFKSQEACIECFNYINQCVHKAVTDLKSEPKKYKIKYAI